MITDDFITLGQPVILPILRLNLKTDLYQADELEAMKGLKFRLARQILEDRFHSET